MAIKNYGSLRPSIKRKLKESGYSEDEGGKTASRKSTSSSKKPKTTFKSKVNTMASKYGVKASQNPFLPSQTPKSKVQPNVIRESTTSGKFYASKAGQLVSGLKEGVLTSQPTGGDFQTLPAGQQLGYGIGMMVFLMNPSTGELGMGTKNAAVGTWYAAKKLLTYNPKVGQIPVRSKNMLSISTKSAYYKPNTKSMKQLGSWIKKNLSLKNPKISVPIIVGAISTWAWDSHLKVDNLLGTLQITARDARKQGYVEEAQELDAALDDVTNPSFYREVRAKLPFWNIYERGIEIVEAAALVKNINHQIDEENLYKQENGLTENDMWDIRNKKKFDAELFLQQNYNENRARMFEYEQEAIRESQAISQARNMEEIDYYNQEAESQQQRQHAREKYEIDYYNKKQSESRKEQRDFLNETRRAEIKARNEDAEFWRKEREKQYEREAEDRKAMADYWTQYRKQIAQQEDDSRPSNLKFGLL